MRVLATIVSTFLLAGCGGAGAASQTANNSVPTPTPTTASTPTVQRYQTVAALKDAAVAAGLACPEWTQNDIVTVAAESGTCSDESVLSTYATDSDLDTALADLRSMNELMQEQDIEVTPILVGPNWIINSPDAAQIAVQLGGTVDRTAN